MFFDTNYGNDLAVIEVGTELFKRISKKGSMPLITSNCPACVSFIERFYPNLINYLSKTKSSHMLLAKMIKTYFAEKMNIQDVFNVSLQPCVSTKYEIEREELSGTVDAVLTTREFAKLMKRYELNWNELKGGEFDPLFNESSGSANLFDVTGGMCEACIRFIHEKITGDKIGNTKYEFWRGFTTLKTSNISIAGKDLKVVVCNGISSFKTLMQTGQIKNFTFIEVVACPSGCINGGGQPKLKRKVDANKRGASIYSLDLKSNLRTANDNEGLNSMYEEFLGQPGGSKACELLQTSYVSHAPPKK